jgi:hypothetical protein
MEVLTAFLTVLRIAELWSGREKSIHARNYGVCMVIYNNNAKNSRRMPSFKWERRSLGPTKGVCEESEAKGLWTSKWVFIFGWVKI